MSIDSLLRKWKIENIENEIIGYLESGKKVIIEDGCLVDEIISYIINNGFHGREVIFTTSNAVFPLYINLMDDLIEDPSRIRLENYEGTIFVEL